MALLKTVTFLRHGQALNTLGQDQERPLTNYGRIQAQKRAEELTMFHFDLVITSSALRTIQTADEILHTLSISPKREEISSLYLPQNIDEREQVIEMLQEIGSKELRAYLEHDNHSSWENYSSKALHDLVNSAKSHHAQHLLVIGHGNIINSLGLFLKPEETSLLSIYFDCCEGFFMDYTSKNISYFKG